MNLRALSNETLSKLKEVSTPTLATQLFQRNLRYTYVQGASLLNRTSLRMVGEAYTLRYIPAREDLDTIDVFQDRQHPQRAAVENCPEGHVLVMDCRRDARAASAGSILLTRMEVRGVAGMVSDAGVRDAGHVYNSKFPVFCAGPSAPTNLVLHHAVDAQVPIGCGGAPVYPGDIMVGDADGVIVVPREIADALAEQAYEQEQIENVIIDEVRKGAALPGTYPPTKEKRIEFRKRAGLNNR